MKSLEKIATARSAGTTHAQLDVVQAIRRLRERHPGYGPSYRELADELGVRINDVVQKIARLERDGLVERVPGIARSLSVVGDE